MPMGQLVKPDQLAILATYMLSPHSGVKQAPRVRAEPIVIGSDHHDTSWMLLGISGNGPRITFWVMCMSRQCGHSVPSKESDRLPAWVVRGSPQAGHGSMLRLLGPRS